MQDPLSIQVTDFLLVVVRNLQVVQPFSGYSIRLVWPVNREENVFRTERHKRAQESRDEKIPAGRNNQILS